MYFNLKREESPKDTLSFKDHLMMQKLNNSVPYLGF